MLVRYYENQNEGVRDVVKCMKFIHALVNMLIEKDVPELSACSQTQSREETMPDGVVRKESIFKFVKYRRYI
jgi:hypothetical protein